MLAVGQWTELDGCYMWTLMLQLKLVPLKSSADLLYWDGWTEGG